MSGVRASVQEREQGAGRQGESNEFIGGCIMESSYDCNVREWSGMGKPGWEVYFCLAARGGGLRRRRHAIRATTAITLGRHAVRQPRECRDE